MKKKIFFILPFFMQLFSSVATEFSNSYFFPQKFLIIGQNLLFNSPAQPRAQN